MTCCHDIITISICQSVIKLTKKAKREKLRGFCETKRGGGPNDFGFVLGNYEQKGGAAQTPSIYNIFFVTIGY